MLFALFIYTLCSLLLFSFCEIARKRLSQKQKNGSLASVLKELSNDYLGDQSNFLKGSSTGVSAK